jgi:hypothetical protein
MTGYMAEYGLEIKNKIWPLIAQKYVDGQTTIKISEVKENFKTVTPIYLEQAFVLLVTDRKLTVEGSERKAVYTINEAEALLTCPPPEPKKKKKKCERSEKNEVGGNAISTVTGNVVVSVKGTELGLGL